MFEQTDFFTQYDEETTTRFGGLGNTGRAIGKWLGFATIFTVLAFTAYHGINATWQYQAHSLAGRLTGTVGIISVELIIFSLILKWHNRGITGAKQRVAAGVTFAAGLVLIFLAVITDSQLNAGLALTTELAFYLQWVLPVSPVVMAVLNHIVDELDPAQLWSQQQAEEQRQLDEIRFKAAIAGQRAELAARKAIVNANLNARVSAAKQIAAYYQSDSVQDAIRRSALGNVPALLRAIGVDPDTIPDVNANGELDLTDVAAYLEQHPEAAARLFGVAREQDEEAAAAPQAPDPERRTITIPEPVISPNGHGPDTNFQ